MSYHRSEHFKPHFVKPSRPSLRWRVYYRKEHLLCHFRNFKDRHPVPAWLKSLGRDISQVISIFQRSRRGW
jgi:hypothetical protein